MNIEYEATFPAINKDEIIQKLKNIGAELVRREFVQKRIVFHLPKGHRIKGGWLRVRDEDGIVTMSLKIVDGDAIEDQKEICIEVSDFKNTEKLLTIIGCEKKAYQENKRELWRLNDVEITIDEWPFLEPFLEIEGDSEKSVRKVAEKLALDYSKAIFGSVDVLYSHKYGIPKEVINNKTPMIVFGEENPFRKR